MKKQQSRRKRNKDNEAISLARKALDKKQAEAKLTESEKTSTFSQSFSSSMLRKRNSAMLTATLATHKHGFSDTNFNSKGAYNGFFVIEEAV